MAERLARGYPIERLPGEREVRHITAFAGPEGSDHLILTDKRLVALTNHKLLWMIPIGISVESAFVKDVDVSGLAHRRLSILLAIFGAFLAFSGIAGLSQSEEDGGGRGAMIFIMLLGFGLVAAWLLIKRKYLVFTVSGTWHFSFRAIGGNSDANIASFLNAFALLKEGHDPGDASSTPAALVSPPSGPPPAVRAASPANRGGVPSTPRGDDPFRRSTPTSAVDDSPVPPAPPRE